MTKDLPLANSTNEPRLFCCEIDWLGREPKFSGQRIDECMTWALNIFDVHWKRRWPIKLSTVGAVLASNVELADYFRLVYRTDLSNGHVPLTSPTNFVEFAADMALDSFRRHSVRLLHSKPEQDGAANRSQQIGPAKNQTLSAPGSGG